MERDPVRSNEERRATPLEYAVPAARRRWTVRRAIGLWRWLLYPVLVAFTLSILSSADQDGVWISERGYVSANSRFFLKWFLRGDDGTWTREERRDAMNYSASRIAGVLVVRENWGGTRATYVAVPVWVAVAPIWALVAVDLWFSRRQARRRFDGAERTESR